MCKMIGRNSVRFKKNDILHILRHFNFALNHIVKITFFIKFSRRFKAKSPAHTCINISLDLLKREVTAFCPFAPIALDAFVFLCSTNFIKFIGRTKTRISKSLLNKCLCISLINLNSCTLIIRSVVADFFFITDNTLIGIDAVNRKSLEHYIDSTLNLTLLVGILNSYIKHTVGGFCCLIRHHTSEQVAKMQKACWARCKTSYPCTLFKCSWRIHIFHILRSLCYVRKQKLCQFFIISHIFSLTNYKIFKST